MRIAEIATLARPVPPRGEGSIESLVARLVEDLTARGHEVTLFATADSTTPATLRSPVPKGYRSGGEMWDWQLYESWQVREAFRAADDFDIIHCHSYHHGMLYCDFVKTPSLHTMHVEPGPDYRFLAERTTNRHLHFASHWQAREFEDLPGVHVIPHGIDLSEFEPRPRTQRDDFLLYLGRFLDEKGPVEAIEIARKCGRRIKLAGPTNPFFESNIRPLLESPTVEYLGEVGPAQRRELLASAGALLYPLKRPEPFGLVLVEALASGLPVLACGGGAINEIVVDGKTGFLCDTPEGIADQVTQAKTLDPAELRQEAEERFGRSRMADALEQLMRDIVESTR